MTNPARTIPRVGIMAALTAAGALIRIPLPYIPVTLQVTCVVLAGLWLGPRLGPLSQLVYLCLGLLGFPVFAGGGGLHYALQPTFGYLLAFPLAAATTGILSRGACTPARAIAAVLAGLSVIYGLGILGFYLNLRYLAEAQISLAAAFRLGIMPLPKDLLLAVPTAWAGLRLRESWRMQAGASSSLAGRADSLAQRVPTGEKANS